MWDFHFHSQLQYWRLYALSVVLGIGGSFQYGIQVSVIASPEEVRHPHNILDDETITKWPKVTFTIINNLSEVFCPWSGTWKLWLWPFHSTCRVSWTTRGCWGTTLRWRTPPTSSSGPSSWPCWASGPGPGPSTAAAFLSRTAGEGHRSLLGNLSPKDGDTYSHTFIFVRTVNGRMHFLAPYPNLINCS